VKPDDELIGAVQSGDVAAFEHLVARHYALALRFAWRQLGERADAEEAVQDALLRAYRALRGGAKPAQFRAWLLRIVVNRCRSMHVRRLRRRRLFEWWRSRRAEDDASSRAAPDVAGEMEPVLRQALQSLSPTLREAFLLKHVEELSYEEMARLTGVGVSALKMRVKRAVAQLQQELREDG
jgi:RNA polymerase sigma-70 factor (ECF subfamily)